MCLLVHFHKHIRLLASDVSSSLTNSKHPSPNSVKPAWIKKLSSLFWVLSSCLDMFLVRSLLTTRFPETCRGSYFFLQSKILKDRRNPIVYTLKYVGTYKSTGIVLNIPYCEIKGAQFRGGDEWALVILQQPAIFDTWSRAFTMFISLHFRVLQPV